MRYLVLTCTMFACVSVTFAQMTHEETVVRTAYAKLSYACEQHVVIQLANESLGPVAGPMADQSGMTGGQRLSAAHVGFTLNDFVVGKVSDVAGRKVSDFVSPVSGEVLTASTGVIFFDESGTAMRAEGAIPQWQAMPAPPSPEEKMPEMKLTDALQQGPAADWERYASYSVTVTFGGKIVGPYKAMFIFGHDPAGNEVIRPIDATVQADGLANELQSHLFPDALLRTRLRNSTVVTRWLAERKMSSPSCSVGQKDVCCDLIRMQCSPGRDDVAQALSEPLQAPPAKR